MITTCRRVAGIAVASTVLLVGAGGPALAAAVPPAPAGLLRAGIVPGDLRTGYPGAACTPANDGEEVTTLVTVLDPFPTVSVINWRCHGRTGTWRPF